MTVSDLIENLYARMIEADQRTLARMKERPICAEDYADLWTSVAAEINMTHARGSY